MWDREKIFFSAGTLFKEFSLFKKKQEKKRILISMLYCKVLMWQYINWFNSKVNQNRYEGIKPSVALRRKDTHLTSKSELKSHIDPPQPPIRPSCE